MPGYLAESYLAGGDDAASETRARIAQAAASHGSVHHLRTIHIPADELMLHLFEAPTAEDVERFGRGIALVFHRIVETDGGDEAEIGHVGGLDRIARDTR